MTDKKILSPAEALRALADGKKLTFRGQTAWIYLECGKIVWSNGTDYRGDFIESSEYIEPKPKVVWVEYLYTIENAGETFSGGTEWYTKPPVSKEDWHYTPTGRKIEV